MQSHVLVTIKFHNSVMNNVKKTIGTNAKKTIISVYIHICYETIQIT